MNNNVPLYCTVLAIMMFASCKSTLPSGAFDEQSTVPIDYQNIDNWAAHPDKTDAADSVPGQVALADQSLLDVDVFFVHPTTYTGKKGQNKWNAELNDQQLNDDTDGTTIKFQASIFNQVGKIYAPRYRQAHLQAYFTDDKAIAQKAFNKAYKDVKSAFDYYINKENKGRPFIIASHSQGTTHCKRLIAELIDGKPIADRMIAAYLIGIDVRKDQFQDLTPCESPDETGCIISWRTFKKGHYPDKVGSDILVTNPLSWTTTDEYVSADQNLGAVLRDFDKILIGRVDAQVSNGVLWANKPKFPWSFMFTTKDYHIADMNFYYYNIQQNAKSRAQAYFENQRNK